MLGSRRTAVQCAAIAMLTGCVVAATGVEGEVEIGVELEAEVEVQVEAEEVV